MVQYETAQPSFAALSDATRRGILEYLVQCDATISDLASRFQMTLTGIKKHVQVLEEVGLVATEKRGRTRYCRLGANRLDDESEWIAKYRHMLEARLDHLAAFVERGEPSTDKGDR